MHIAMRGRPPFNLNHHSASTRNLQMESPQHVRPPSNSNLLLDYFRASLQASRRSASVTTPVEVHSCELASLLQSVHLVRLPSAPSSRRNTSFAAGPRQRSLVELVNHARRSAIARAAAPGRHQRDALESESAREALISPAWAALHMELGDAAVLDILTEHQVYMEVRRDCWLQLAGRCVVSSTPGRRGRGPVQAVTRRAGSRREPRPSKRQRLAENAVAGAADPQAVPPALAASAERSRAPEYVTSVRRNQRSRNFRPSQWVVPAGRIYFAPHFSAGCGLLGKHPLRTLPPTRRGAERLMRWILGPSLFSARGMGLQTCQEHLGRRRKAKRGDGSREPLRQSTVRSVAGTHAGTGRALSSSPLLNPLHAMLVNSRSVDFVNLLAHHCPSSDAVHRIAAFDRRHGSARAKALSLPSDDHSIFGEECAPSLDLHGPSTLGRVCFCSFPQHAKKVIADTPQEAICSGGKAEMEFMRKFPVLSCAVPQRRVMAFLTAACHSLLGNDHGSVLFGSARNWRLVLKVVEQLVLLRRGEAFSAHDALRGVSRKDFKNTIARLAGIGPSGGPHRAMIADGRFVDELLARLVYFLVAHVGVPLLRECFYVTDAEPTGTQTVFFRKNVWHLIRSRADCGYLHLCLKQQNVQCEDDARAPVEARAGGRVQQLRKRRRDGGAAVLPPAVRWVPKKTGLRPIVNLSRVRAKGLFNSSTSGTAAGKQAQQDAVQVFAHLRAEKPEAMGSSVMSQAEVHGPLARGLASLNTAMPREPGGKLPRLYVAVADLSNCYERISHDSLLSTLAKLPVARKYSLDRLRVHHVQPVGMEALRSSGGGVQSTRQSMCTVASPRRSGELARLLSSPQCPAALQRRGSFIMPGERRKLHGDQAIETAKAAVIDHRVVLGTQRGRRYAAAGSRALLLARGIPQGASLSPFMCALHMAAGDIGAGDALPDARSGFVLRLVDDFLIVSTEQRVAERFLAVLARPDNPYGGDLNVAKVVTNFPIQNAVGQESAPQPRGLQGQGLRTIVPWVGLTISPESTYLNVSAHAARSGTCVANTLSIRRARSATHTGKSLWKQVVDTKLRRFLDLKLSNLLLDPALSSRQCILANIARVCGLCALRFSWLVLRRRPRLIECPPPQAVANVAVRMAHHAARLVVRRQTALRQKAGVAAGGHHQTSQTSIARTEVEGLCLEAFQAALRPRRRLPPLAAAYQALGAQRRRSRNRIGAQQR